MFQSFADYKVGVISFCFISTGARGPETYRQVYDRSIRDPEGFWAEEASRIAWMKPWSRVLDNSNPPFTKWCPQIFITFFYW